MTVRAIETGYRGYRFRSRLEALWAVFFDKIGVNWEYEPEGFDIDGLRYLPDFRVTSRDRKFVVYYEVKPPRTWQDDKVDALKDAWARETQKYIVLVGGDPIEAIFDRGNSLCPRCGNVVQEWSDSIDTFQCAPCDFNTPCGGDEPLEHGLKFEVRPHKGSIVMKSWPDAIRWKQFVTEAAKAARSARFEHGEAP